MTLQEVKVLIRRTEGFTEADNAYILAMIPLVEAYVMKRCNIPSIPKSLHVAIAKIIQFEMDNSAVNSKSIGDIRLSYRDSYPQSITDMLNDHHNRRVKIV